MSHPAASPRRCSAAARRERISPEPPCPGVRRASASLRSAASRGRRKPADRPPSESPSCWRKRSPRCLELWWPPGEEIQNHIQRNVNPKVLKQFTWTQSSTPRTPGIPATLWNSWKDCSRLDGSLFRTFHVHQCAETAMNTKCDSRFYLSKVMNWGAFSTKALVTLETHLDMDAWLIPMMSPMEVWNDPDV